MWKNQFYDAEEEETVRSFAALLRAVQDDEEYETSTSIEQARVEDAVLRLYETKKEPVLAKSKHAAFLKKSLTHISKSFEVCNCLLEELFGHYKAERSDIRPFEDSVNKFLRLCKIATDGKKKLVLYEECVKFWCLDCSRPWLCYWSLHSLQILGVRLEDEEYEKIVGFLVRCQSPQGGYGGGPGQHPHLASTYAAVSALCIIGTAEAYRSIDRQGLRRFFQALKAEDGGISMHVDGEVDVRGVYCAIAVAKLTNIYSPELFTNTDEWVAQCQTWEGGFGGCPGMEAHGGYTYCGLASLVLLGKTNLCHIPSLLRWMVNKQMRLEGGFQGRTNKLVDGCYSFWQGAAFPLIHATLSSEGKLPNSNYWIFDQEALQEYILICCQHPWGGLLDKPDKHRDTYHTCYTLSGLSIAQNSPTPLIVGPRHLNSVEIIHPLFNLVLSSVAEASNHFNKLPIPD